MRVIPSAVAASRPARRVALGALLVAAVALASCSRDSQVLARVGSRTITAGEFIDYARSARGQYPWLPDSAKRTLLDDLIRRDLMLEEATRRGIVAPADLDRIRGNAEEELLIGALSNQLAPSDVPVSAAEIEAFYDWHRTEHKVQVIYAPNASMANHAIARLDAGEPFDAVARQFDAGGIVPPDGELGWVPGGALPEPLDTRTREARVGEIIGPLRTAGDNWFVARVLERRPTAQLPPLQALREQLVQQIRGRKHRAAIQRVVDSMSAQYRLRLEPGGAQALYASASAPLADTSAAEHAARERVVLARYDGATGPGTFTLADAMADMQGPSDRPNFSSLPAIERWIQSRVVRRLVLIEAKRRHLQEEPENARRIERRVEGALLESIYNAEIASQVAVTEDDMRAEFRRRVQGAHPMPFESMPPAVREQLRSLTLETKRDERLKQFTYALRGKFPVHVNEGLLHRLEWPGMPGAPQG